MHLVGRENTSPMVIIYIIDYRSLAVESVHFLVDKKA